MILYSLNGDYPKPLPNRIRMPDGSTRTDKNTFTEEEIDLAGYKLINIPTYNNLTEYLNWNGEFFEVTELPPLPNWDTFNIQMMSNSRFNVVYNQTLLVAPIIANALPTALDQVTDKGTSLFNIIWNQLCQIGGATSEDRLVWANLAEENNLPSDFIQILHGN